MITPLESLIENCSLQEIAHAIAWFDQQSDIGPGVLVEVIRRGAIAPAPTGQREYGRQIAAWLARHFPDLDRPEWGPHPAAIAAVIRLHGKHGKGRLTVREHGPEIRAAVKAWEARYSGDGDFTDAELELIERRSAEREQRSSRPADELTARRRAKQSSQPTERAPS